MINNKQYEDLYLNNDGKNIFILIGKVSETHKQNINTWKSEVKTITGNGTFELENNKPTKIYKLNVNFLVESIESGKNKMDTYIFEALREERNPTINLKISEVSPITNETTSVRGMITIGGITKPISLKGTVTSFNEEIYIKGSTVVDMTRFNITPPSVMFGSVIVNKNVTIDYSLVLSNQERKYK